MARALCKTILAALAACALAADARAHPPWGIAVDRQGRVYFSDLEAVWKIDARGRLSLFRPGGRDTHTHELNLDEAGNVYGEDLRYEPATQRYFAALWKMTPAGDFSYILAPTVGPPLGTSIWRDRAGNTYLAYRNDATRSGFLLIKRAPGGGVSTLGGDPAAAARERQVVPYGVGGMAFGADGTLYFTDGEGVGKMTAAGAVSTVVRSIAAENPPGDTTADRARLLGITVDGRGNVYAADLGGRRVLRVKPDGAVETVARAEPPWMPSGVASKDGDLFILEVGDPARGPRVRKLSPDGRMTVLAAVGETPPVRPSGESPAGNPDVKAGAFRRNGMYALVALGGVFTVAILIWRAGRKSLRGEGRRT